MPLPWWALAYLLVYAGIGIASAIDGRRRGESSGWLLGDLLATVTGSIFVIAFFEYRLLTALGKAVFPLFVATVAFEIASAMHDLRNPKLFAADRTEDRIGVALSILLIAPALIVGAVLSWRALGLSFGG